MVRKKKQPKRADVYRFLVVLAEVDPPVWRRIEVPETYTFWDLHVAIQDAMGWQDSHLHEFRAVRPNKPGIHVIGIPDADMDREKVIESWNVPVADFFDPRLGPPLPVTYTYDFGDDWRHIVMLEGPEWAEDGVTYPRCVAGARKCPPEDCGGPHGYQQFLVAIANPRHAEHKALLEWAGGSYDPDDFDPKLVRFDDPRQRLRFALGDDLDE